jgi:hypothetical protein
MIDPSESMYFIAYAAVCLGLIVSYIRIKSEEGVIITTKEFQNFQTGFIGGYSIIILCELIASASFYHTFLSLHLSLEQITKLYLTTVVSTIISQVLNEIFDIGARRDKCVLSAILYSVSMFSMFFGGHYEMLLMGRMIYGMAQALQQSAFENYAVHEHASRGFPEDWLSHTFTILTHTMALIAALSGIVGQVAATFGQFGCVAVTSVLFASAAVFMMVAWEKDVNMPRFMMSGFIFNFNHAISALRTNRQMFLLVVISSLCETSIIIFTFYWAPWLTDLSTEEDRHLPYEILFATFVATSMIGNYLFQIFVSGKGQQQSQGNGSGGMGVEQIFQILLICSSASYFLGAVASTRLVAFIMSLIVQACIGMYWPSIGYLRGRIIPSDLRNMSLLLPK